MAKEKQVAVRPNLIIVPPGVFQDPYEEIIPREATFREMLPLVMRGALKWFTRHFSRMDMWSRIDNMIMEARAGNLFVRVFDVRYATEGHPELGSDHIYFPGNSREVLETGPLGGASQNTQVLPYGKMVPLHAVLLVELCLKK